MTGVEIIAAERQRQIEEEGWTAKHDAQHKSGELAEAAVVYALFAAYDKYPVIQEAALSYDWAARFWPWEGRWLKPKDRLHDLTRAGALIAAEIDRVLAEEAQKATVDQILAKTQRATP